MIAQPFARRATSSDCANSSRADIAHVTRPSTSSSSELEASDTPLIGFAGAPFTVASYLVEGAPTRDFAVIKSLMHA